MDSDVARGLKGVHEKPDLPETFHERHTREFVGESGALPSPRKKTEFGIGGGAIFACIEGSLAFFSFFLVDILSRSQFLSTPTAFLCKFRQIAKPIFSKKWCNPQTSLGSARWVWGRAQCPSRNRIWWKALKSDFWRQF